MPSTPCPSCQQALTLRDTRLGQQAWWCDSCERGWLLGSLPASISRKEEPMQESNLIRLTGLWKSESKAGGNYLSGSISASSKLLVLPNSRKEKDSDPDFIAYMAPQEKKEPSKQRREASSPDAFSF
jgi:hypothetical protein